LESEGGVVSDPWEQIMENDELVTSIAKGTSFSNFSEARIKFAPSYQRHDGPQGTVTDDGDVRDLRRAFALENKKDGKARVPSYTDRILVHSLKGPMQDKIRCREYYIVENIDVSDHRPICATYILTVNTNSPTVLYQRDVSQSVSYMETKSTGGTFLFLWPARDTGHL
jgi:hypothetical protein